MTEIDFTGERFVPGKAPPKSVDELVACLTTAGLAITPPVHGQRHQRYFGSRLMKNLYRSLLRPGVRFAPEVTPVRPGKAPRFIVVGCRPA